MEKQIKIKLKKLREKVEELTSENSSLERKNSKLLVEIKTLEKKLLDVPEKLNHLILEASEEGFKEGRISVSNAASSLQPEPEKETIKILAHNILPDVGIVRSSLIHLKRFLENKSLLNENINLLENDEIDLELMNKEDLEEKVDEVINQMDQHLKKFEETISETKRVIELDLNSTDFVKTNLSKLMNDYLLIRSADFRNIFKIESKIENGLFIRGNETTWKEVLNQLLRNTRLHAFDKYDATNRVYFSLQSKRFGEIEIVFSNNGNKFTLSKEDFIKKGEKKNSNGLGLGGYYINKVVEAHNGKLFIDENFEGFKIVIKIDRVIIYRRGRGRL